MPFRPWLCITFKEEWIVNTVLGIFVLKTKRRGMHTLLCKCLESSVIYLNVPPKEPNPSLNVLKGSLATFLRARRRYFYWFFLGFG